MTSDGAERESWKYLAVCVPIVVLVTPLSSMLASHFHRLVLALLVHLTDTVSLLTALYVIPIYQNGNPIRIIVMVGLVVLGFSFFGFLSSINMLALRFSSYNSRSHSRY